MGWAVPDVAMSLVPSLVCDFEQILDGDSLQCMVAHFSADGGSAAATPGGIRVVRPLDGVPVAEYIGDVAVTDPLAGSKRGKWHLHHRGVGLCGGWKLFCCCVWRIGRLCTCGPDVPHHFMCSFLRWSASVDSSCLDGIDDSSGNQ